MKKNLIRTVFVAAFALVAGYGVYTSHQERFMSDIAMANVEALANGENEYQGTLYGNASGTRFCCCPGSTRTCAAAKCANC